MRRECNIKVHEDNNTATIEILGDLSESALKAMDAAQQKAFSYNPSSIVVRFDGRSRLNSTGISILINLVIDSRERGCKVYLTGMSDHFMKIFGMVGLVKYAEIVESVEEIQAEEAD
jgi:anti-anti-sigma factor